MILMVGLGNPGRDYAGHRHNIGFMAVDAIRQRHGFTPWKRAREFHGEVAGGDLAGQKILLLKPETYMNDSGRSVGAAARFYKLAERDVVVFHDELDLAPGKVRVKTGGGHAGHNGLRSIDAHFGTLYRRVRLGIGHPGDKALVLRYVLGDFDRADQAWLDPLLAAVAAAVPMLAAGDDSRFQTEIARLTAPPPARLQGD